MENSTRTVYSFKAAASDISVIHAYCDNDGIPLVFPCLDDICIYAGVSTLPTINYWLNQNIDFVASAEVYRRNPDFAPPPSMLLVCDSMDEHAVLWDQQLAISSRPRYTVDSWIQETNAKLLILQDGKVYADPPMALGFAYQHLTPKAYVCFMSGYHEYLGQFKAQYMQLINLYQAFGSGSR